MRAVILVGGEGTRLRPLTYTTPKQMLPVVDTPMIERVVGHLASHGITDVVLSLGYRPDAFIAGYPDSRCGGATLTYVVEPELLDTAGAIRFAATQAGIANTFLVFNGDVLTDLDITGLVKFHRDRGGEGTIALTPVEDPSAFGVVPTEPDGRVAAFIEKPAPGTAPTNMINAGTYVLEPSVLDRIPTGRRVNIERETFPAMVADGVLYAQETGGYWLDVGTAERYLTACSDLVDGTRPGSPVPGAWESTPGVWQVGSAAIEGKVGGCSFVGNEARIGPSALVEASVLGTGVAVAEGAIVRRSVVMAGARIGAGAEVCDTIVGPDATVGAGAQLRGQTIVGAGTTVADGAIHDAARLPD